MKIFSGEQRAARQTDSFLERESSSRTLVARLTEMAMFVFSVDVLVAAALHLLNPGVNPVERTVSEYAVGPYGLLMLLVFFTFSLGISALAVGFYRGLPGSRRSRTVLTLLLVCAAGAALAGIFPTDLKDAPRTFTGTLHSLASGVAFPSVVLAFWQLSHAFAEDERWRPFARTAQRLSLVAAVLLAATFLTSRTEIAGLTQRAFLSSALLWLLLAGRRLRQSARG